MCLPSLSVVFKPFARFFFLLAVFISGGVCTFALQIFFATLLARGEPITADFKAPNEFYESVQVKPGHILPQDNWILDYNVSFAIVHSVALEEDNMCTALRTYGLVLFKRKNKPLDKELPNRSAYFWIAGLKTADGRNEFAGFRVLPRNLTNDSEKILFKVVSFPASFFRSRELKIASDLELRSDDPRKYSEWFQRK